MSEIVANYFKKVTHPGLFGGRLWDCCENRPQHSTTSEVKHLRDENSRLKELLGESALENQLLKKSLNA